MLGCWLMRSADIPSPHLRSDFSLAGMIDKDSYLNLALDCIHNVLLVRFLLAYMNCFWSGLSVSLTERMGSDRTSLKKWQRSIFSQLCQWVFKKGFQVKGPDIELQA